MQHEAELARWPPSERFEQWAERTPRNERSRVEKHGGSTLPARLQAPLEQLGLEAVRHDDDATGERRVSASKRVGRFRRHRHDRRRPAEHRSLEAVERTWSCLVGRIARPEIPQLHDERHRRADKPEPRGEDRRGRGRRREHRVVTPAAQTGAYSTGASQGPGRGRCDRCRTNPDGGQRRLRDRPRTLHRPGTSVERRLAGVFGGW